MSEEYYFDERPGEGSGQWQPDGGGDDGGGSGGGGRWDYWWNDPDGGDGGDDDQPAAANRSGRTMSPPFLFYVSTIKAFSGLIRSAESCAERGHVLSHHP